MSGEFCPFCSQGEYIVKENGLAYVLLSNPRKVAGHFLVIPKRHIEKPWEATPEEMAAIFELIFFVQKRLIEKICRGCYIRQNYMPFIKQNRVKIDHVHYHIIPRSPYDELYQKVEKRETELFTDLSESEREQMAKLLE